MLETDDAQGAYSQWEIGPRLTSIRQAHEEMRRPAGRFRAPLSLFERARFALSSYVTRFLIYRDMPVYLENGTPLNWQLLLNFLYREGILESPRVSEPRFRTDRPRKPTIALRARLDEARARARKHPHWGYGSSESFDDAISKALGELLERYFGATGIPDNLKHASTLEMQKKGAPLLAPAACDQFESWQRDKFPELQYSDESKFHWLLAEELVSRTKTYVPAQLMFWAYDWRAAKEPLLIPMTSNGSAGYFSRSEALIAAIHEYVQRDAFLIYWMNTLSPRVIDVSSIDDEDVCAMLAKAARYNLTPYFLNITTDLGIPVSACILVHDEQGTPFITAGAATGKSAKESLISSYYEALAVQHGAAGKHGDVAFSLDNYEPFARADIGMEERTKLWYGTDMYEKARFFFTGPRQKFSEFAASFPAARDPQAELDALRETFRAKGSGYEIFAHEVEHPTLTTLGYHVVRVFIPALVPMHLQEHLAALANVRLTRVPQQLGYTDAQRNIYPHPFP